MDLCPTLRNGGISRSKTNHIQTPISTFQYIKCLQGNLINADRIFVKITLQRRSYRLSMVMLLRSAGKIDYDGGKRVWPDLHRSGEGMVDGDDGQESREDQHRQGACH